MTLKAITQITLYIESFKNIDLADQGIYNIKCRISCDNTCSPPHRNFETKVELKSRKKNKIKQQAELQDLQYKTKSFLLKYNDEQIDLEQVIVFRFEQDTLPANQPGNIYLHFDLYYSVDYLSGFQNVNDKHFEFQKVDSIKLKLNNVERGIASYINTTFSDQNKSALKIYVFSMTMDVKFRTYKYLKKQKTPTELERQKISSIKDFFQYFLKKTKEGEGGFYRKYVKTLVQVSEFAKKTILACLNTKVQYKYRLPKYCIADNQKSLELVEVQPKTYMQYISTYNIDSYNHLAFQEEIQQISGQNFLFFQTFLEELEKGSLNKVFLKTRYDQFSKERFGQFIFQSHATQDELSDKKHSAKEKISLAKAIRKKKHYFDNLEPYEIEEDDEILAEHPIIFHEITEIQKERQTKETEKRQQLFVLSHGFQGSSDDMVTIRNNFKLYFPKAYFLIARSNEGMTNGDIRKMGERLAKEIDQYILQENLSHRLLIHFVGHSLGGIILRASLKHLDKYADYFGTFISFSSPHLSYLNGTKTSIETGLWFIKKWKKIESLDQMTMSDNNKNLEDTFMFNLSKQGSLQNFNRVVLVSCAEDSYVPWHSARIHRSSNWQGQSIALQNSMVTNIFKPGKLHKIHRLGIDFHIAERNLDSVIGRTAHIRFLTDQTILQMMLSCIPQLFQ